MIRELHVYGQTLNLTVNRQPSTVNRPVQHTGLGKELMKEAEKIAKKKSHNKIKVISGVGVREYYRKLGYKLDKQKIYMEKQL